MLHVILIVMSIDLRLVICLVGLFPSEIETTLSFVVDWEMASNMGQQCKQGFHHWRPCSDLVKMITFYFFYSCTCTSASSTMSAVV